MSILGSAFKGIKEVREPERPSAQAFATPQLPTALPGQKLAKRSDPDFEPVKIYIRKKTRKAASRKWEDADGGDFSELVEELLQQYSRR